MNRFISPTTRIATGLALLLVTLVLSAHGLGLIPDRTALLRGERAARCEALAVYISMLAASNESAQIDAGLQTIGRRDTDLLHAVVSRTDGREVARLDKAADDNSEVDMDIYEVPIFAGGGNRRWGVVQCHYLAVEQGGWWGALANSFARLVAFIAAAGFLGCFLFMRRTLVHLDPNKVVPPRVRAALDTLTSGLVLIDQHERVAFANSAFGEKAGRPADSLLGQSISDLAWETTVAQGETTAEPLPWWLTLQHGLTTRAVTVRLKRKKDDRTFLVNSAPLATDRGKTRGALVSFEDISALDRKRRELAQTLDVLRHSRDKIRTQNEQLRVMATQDPLTGCLNRRAFFERFEALWAAAARHGHPLGCIMIDVDHFKSINDNHGHSMGDQVLRLVADTIRSTLREEDILARYGGEEFCVLTPHLDMAGAQAAAERHRSAIESQTFPHGSLTASLGVSTAALGAADPHELMDQADKCLYVAKDSGRNRVVGFDQVPADLEIDQSLISRVPAQAEDQDVSIPFFAVTGLISAMAFRDLRTAEHSRRVADYCVTAAAPLMPQRDVYNLEVAALLHDVGKLGLPDCLLGDFDELSDEEWKLLRAHDEIGIEILRSAFASESLIEIVRNHRAWTNSGALEGRGEFTHASLSARILMIADAFDMMVKGKPHESQKTFSQACDELRRCAGTQFDPELVGHFIASIDRRQADRNGFQSIPVTKETALHIGQEIENLADAIDAGDSTALTIVVSRLRKAANRFGAAPIEAVAQRIEQSSGAQTNDGGGRTMALELLELCRSTQRAWITEDRGHEQSAP